MGTALCSGASHARRGCGKSFRRAVSITASATQSEAAPKQQSGFRVRGIEHYAIIVSNTEAAVSFYNDVLGLPLRPGRPHDTLPYRGEWLALSESQTLHLMELPNPDPTNLSERPEHGGRDRHVCIEIEGDIDALVAQLEVYNVQYTRSKSGRQACFFRDLDSNTVEVAAIN